MQKLFILTGFLMLYCVSLGQNKFTFRADQDTSSEGQIKRLEFVLADLLEKGDIDTYSSYLTEDYVRISANGEVATKEQVLALFRNKPGNTKMMPYDLKVVVYGNTAILYATLDLENKNSTGEITKRSSLITKIFIKREGNWYLASLQGTSVK